MDSTDTCGTFLPSSIGVLLWYVADAVYSLIFVNPQKIEWLSEVAFILSACLTKISVLLFYERLELYCTTTLKRIIWVLVAFTAMSSLACLLTQVLLCQPTSAYWRVLSPTDSLQYSCGNQLPTYLLHGLLDACSTSYCVLIPVLILRNIPMSNFQRNGLRAVLVASLT
jgi:hypothetical protein